MRVLRWTAQDGLQIIWMDQKLCGLFLAVKTVGKVEMGEKKVARKNVAAARGLVAEYK